MTTPIGQKIEEIAKELCEEKVDLPRALQRVAEVCLLERRDTADNIARLVERWHYKKGGYTELAHVIRVTAGRVICDGCNVRPPWEHRCHGDEAVTVGGDRIPLPCGCVECAEARRLFG